MFEATHGSAPKYAGQNKVNPTALILSGMLMLRYLKETEAADRLEQAVAAVIKEGKGLSPNHPICINVDGSTFYKTNNFPRWALGYLDDILGPRGSLPMDGCHILHPLDPDRIVHMAELIDMLGACCDLV